MNFRNPVLLWFIIGAIAMSLFYGFFAVQIFLYPVTSDDDKKNLPKGLRAFLTNQKFPRFTWVHLIYQFWLNFLGSVIGWCSLIAEVSYLTFGFSSLDLNKIHDLLTLRDAILFIVGFIGVVGWLPRTIDSVIASLGIVAKAFWEWLAERLKPRRDRS